MKLVREGLGDLDFFAAKFGNCDLIVMLYNVILILPLLLPSLITLSEAVAVAENYHCG